MDNKHGSHTNQTTDNNRQSDSGDMSTHGEIHKQAMKTGNASVSLDSGLTSALSRAPSPFGQRSRQEPPQAHQPAGPSPDRYQEPQPGAEPYSSGPREPYFSPASSQSTPSEQHYEPSFDDMYPQDHSPDHNHPPQETPAYPAQYDQYNEGMNDVFDEASEKPNSRKTSFLLLAALALVAIVAGGVIYVYKSSTSQTAGNGDVPVIKAEETPTKIAPDKPGGIEIPHQKKLIYDRITGENSESSEQLVSRQEQVAPITSTQPAGNPFDQQSQSSSSAAADTPVSAPVETEQKAKAVLPPNFPSQTSQPAPSPAPSSPVTSASGDYLIQIASFRTQEEAIRNYENLSRRYAGLLSAYGPMIQKADLGSRGIYYRLRIGPMGSKETAANLCSNLIAQGQKDCLVRRK